jgi:RimJ/RimL family protein N-acetyltransferase
MIKTVSLEANRAPSGSRSAEGKGLRELYLGTTEKFLAAHRFYEKNGFGRVGLESLPEAFPRMFLDTRFYRRTLQE